MHNICVYKHMYVCVGLLNAVWRRCRSMNAQACTAALLPTATLRCHVVRQASVTNMYASLTSTRLCIAHMHCSHRRVCALLTSMCLCVAQVQHLFLRVPALLDVLQAVALVYPSALCGCHSLVMSLFAHTIADWNSESMVRTC